MNHREDNPFEDPEVAAQWIASVESDEGSRIREIYPMLREWSTDFADGVVLDIGAGQGICSPYIQAGQYIGIEPSITLVERSRELYGEDGKEFQIGNAYEIPLPDNYVDGAFCAGNSSRFELVAR